MAKNKFVNLRSWSLFLIILCMGVFVLIGVYNINAPGLYYDETLFVNAATGAEADLFIFKRVGNIPVMLMPYIGALKAWLYYPLFRMFEVDYLSLRLPAIFFGLLGICLLWKYIYHQFGFVSAQIFLIIAAVDPSTIFHSRLDWGPTALMMVFRGGLLLSLAYYLQRGKSKYLLLALACAVLRTFDKLNFTWIASASFASAILLYPSRFGKVFLYKNKNFLCVVAIVAFALSIIFLKMFGMRLVDEIGISDLGERVRTFLNLLALTIRGEGVYQVVVGVNHMAFTLQGYALIVTYGISIWGIYRGICSGRINARRLSFLLLFLLFLAIQILFTKKATGPHHFATFAPFWLVFVAIGLGNLLTEPHKSKRILVQILASASVFLIVATSMHINLIYHRSFNGLVKNKHWDLASSTKLVQYLIDKDVKSMVAVDWGLATNVQALANNQIKVVDLHAMFDEGLDAAQSKWIRSEFINSGTVFLLHSEGMETFPAARSHFFDELLSNAWELQKIDEIRTKDGKPYVEVWVHSKSDFPGKDGTRLEQPPPSARKVYDSQFRPPGGLMERFNAAFQQGGCCA